MHVDVDFYFVFQLLDTKTADKKLTLMHFLVDTVQEKFPDILNFESELRFIEKAALGKCKQSVNKQIKSVVYEITVNSSLYM